MIANTTEAARALAAQRPTATYTCQWCGQPFEARTNGGHSTPAYCSTACRSKAYRQRKQANLPA